MNDLKFALRQLLKNPGFTAVAVLTLALGIGANTAIFSVINGVLLRPLPYPEPDRLMTLFERNPQRGIERQPVSPANFAEWERQNQVFKALGFWRGDEPVNLLTPEGTEKVQGAFTSSAVFALLGAKPFLGRLPLPDEDRLRGPLAAVLSYDIWQRRFGGEPNVIGRKLTVDRHGRGDYTIVGVLPAGFRFPGQTDLWMSWSGLSRNRLGATRLNVLGGLKPAVTIERARAEMSALQSRLPAPARGEGAHGSEVAVVPLLDELVGRNMKRALWILWGVVAGVLLIACVNVANLLLARAADRQKEIALRFALGASRWRVTRQLLAESVLLALFGGVLGVVLGRWGLELFLAAAPGNVSRLHEVTFDGTAFFFTVLISLLTGVVFGLAPAWQFVRTDLNGRLKEDNRGLSGGRNTLRIRNSLVVGEVALSLILLIGAGLMLQSFVRLLQTDRGIKPEHVLTAGLDFSMSEFTTWTEPTDTRPQARLQQMLERVRSQAGVQAAGATSWLPRRSSGPPREPVVIVGRASGVADDSPTTDHSGVTPDYFHAMGIPLLRGRQFTEADQLESPPVLIINETLAKRYFPKEDPIGKRLAFASRTNRWAPAEYYDNKLPEIVGVVADVSTLTQNPEVHPHCYYPYGQYPMQNPVLAVRVTGNPAAFTPILRREIKAVAPSLPEPVIQTMGTIFAQTMAQPRFQAWMLTLFGAVALVLAAVGLYGVLAYTVAQRRREIGVRMALGAQRPDVLGLVIGQGMRLAIVGVLLGLMGAFALTRVMQSLLYEVKATDPLTFAAVPLLLLFIALLACWLPARRATRVNPIEALRYE